MKTETYKKIQTILFALMGVLIVILLTYLWVTPNVQEENRRFQRGYQVISDVTEEIMQDADAPVGIRRVMCFLLSEEMEYDTTLLFCFSHQEAEVYLDGEKVYSLQSDKTLFNVRTVGNNWAMIPLYREDMGKEVRVVLTPVYKNYQDQKITFLVGSKMVIFKKQMENSFPAMVLSLIDILVGLALFFVAIYFTIKKVKSGGFYALALLAVSLGIWNFTQTDFVPLLLQDKTVFLYYVSLTMLMVCVIPLIKSLETPRKNFTKNMLEIWCILCSIVCTVELLLQLFGIWDLRDMLKLTHGMIAVSSIILILSGFWEWRNPVEAGEERKNKAVWLLGLGALLDMLLYYFGKGSEGLLFVLLAIFFYVLSEGISLFFTYIQQKQMLEEKDTQLTLSRITTMMSQIRSHFVFNILNAISGMCKYDPEKADETVVRFARYLRNNIDIMEDDKAVPFITELARLEDYVVLEQVRFGDKIEFYSDVKAEDFMIPPLILQPIIENAIKHGITKKQDGGVVILRTWEEAEQIKISVEDDGVGFELNELEKEQSVGLKNIQYRLKYLMQGIMKIESKVGVGTTVTITIPKKEAGI